MNSQIRPWILIYVIWLLLGAYLFHIINHPSERTAETVNSIFEPTSFTISDNVTLLDQAIDRYNGEKRKGYDLDVLVVGKYDAHEENTSIYPNLGLARAIACKNYLSNIAVDIEDIVMGSQLVDEEKDSGNASVSFLPKNKSSWQPEEEEIRRPVHIYIDFTSQKLQLSPHQRHALYDIARFLDINKKALLVVTGHTDAPMDEMESLALSNNHALFVSNILKRNGIDEERMSIVAAGMSKPIADNKTDEGRKMNRRVTIEIKG